VRYVHESRLEVSADEAFAWHARPGALERLLPPWQSVRVVEASGGIQDGARVVLRAGPGPFAVRWVAAHSGYVAGREFADEQVEGPFARWKHVHRFVPEGEGACRYRDEVEYELPLGALGRALGGGAAKKALARMFRFRHARVRDDLARHARLRGRGPLAVAVTGASGLVGSALVPFLTTGGHRVLRLVRRATASPDEVEWRPGQGGLDASRLEGLDAVVHLAGAGITDARWTPERKRVILESRADGTRALCEALAKLARRPRVLVSASAIGYYGNRGQDWVDESSAPGSGFLAGVCERWEEATEPARAAGIRVVRLRIGLALSARGGVLGRMLPAFRMAMGGPLGSGSQYLSWIALDDLVGAVHHLLFADDVEGPVNAVAPLPVDSARFAHVLGRALHRPAVLRVPAAALRFAFGEMADEALLGGARVRPARLEAAGFRFLHPTLESALRAELGLATVG
jgi:hypothetical protein